MATTTSSSTTTTDSAPSMLETIHALIEANKEEEKIRRQNLAWNKLGPSFSASTGSLDLNRSGRRSPPQDLITSITPPATPRYSNGGSIRKKGKRTGDQTPLELLSAFLYLDLNRRNFRHSVQTPRSSGRNKDVDCSNLTLEAVIPPTKKEKEISTSAPIPREELTSSSSGSDTDDEKSREIRGYSRSLIKTEAEFVQQLLYEMENNTPAYLALVKSNAAVDGIFELIKMFIFKEVGLTASLEVLFRTDSTCTNLMKIYARIEGLSYLYQTLEPLIYHLCSNPENYEITSKNKKESKRNMEKLSVTCKLFLDTIIGSLNKCPPRLREICSLMRMTAELKWPEASTNFSYIGGFIFLRLFCPAIVAPAKYRLISGELAETNKERLSRTCILITKALQKAANNSTFEKGQDLYGLNPFITENYRKIQQFFDDISS